MEIISYKDGTAVALGSFDGLHKGHIAVIKSVVDSGYNPVVLFINSSFSLMTKDDVVGEVRKMGVEPIFADFNAICKMSCEEFVRDYLVSKLNAKALSCGYNFNFGKNASGDVETLRKLCYKYNIELFVTQEVTSNGENISSTRIREMLSKGDCEGAKKLLGKNFSFASKVVHGDARGRTLGFPTVNQIPEKSLCNLRYGVYKTIVTIDGKEYIGVTNYGIRPTYRVDSPLAETFVVGFDGDVYDKEIRVSFVRFIRDEKLFSSGEELAEQMKKDTEKALID